MWISMGVGQRMAGAVLHASSSVRGDSRPIDKRVSRVTANVHDHVCAANPFSPAGSPMSAVTTMPTAGS